MTCLSSQCAAERFMMSTHYDKRYFEWQKDIGAFGGVVNLEKFRAHISQSMNVLEFGCGGGYLLKQIRCQAKIGIEINDAARANAAALGLDTFRTIKEAPDGWADCVISNHALEHVINPYEVLVQLKEKMKNGATIIFVVPYDFFGFRPRDINRHLFSWSPMTLGNLFEEAGYVVIETKRLLHKWPPFYRQIYQRLGSRAFNRLSQIHGFLTRHHSGQLRIVAKRQEAPAP